MKYDEYLQCARKHLRGCASLLVTYEAGKNNNNYDNIVWLELYYLAGYIIEGITIYSAYKLNGWNSTDNIICRLRRKQNWIFMLNGRK